MTAKDKAFEAWAQTDFEAVAAVLRARGEENAEIVRTALRKAWDAGREAEREACAKVCDDWHNRTAGQHNYGKVLANAIRARGSQ